VKKKKRIAVDEINLNCRIRLDVVNELDRAAQKMRLSRSEVVRYLVEGFVDTLPESAEFWMALEREKKERLIRYKQKRSK